MNKHNIGDKVWIMKHNKPHKAEIIGIFRQDGKIKYCYDSEINMHLFCPVFEDDTFLTKEELIKSL